MVLNTSASISLSQLNSTVFFTNGNLGVNTTSPTVNLDVNGGINVSDNSSLANVTATNISVNNLISTTSISSGLLSATNVIGTNITASTLSASTISASNLSLSGNLNIGGTLTTVNITSTNIKDTNISTGTLIVSGTSTLTNVTATTISSGNFIANTGITSGTIRTGTSTIANLNATNISTGAIKVNTGITTGTITLASGQASLGNATATNITSSSLNVSGTSSLTNTIATNFSVGTAIASTGITTGVLNASGTSNLANTTFTNISTGGLNVSGTSVLSNLVATNISTGGLNASGASTLTNTTATNISTAVLIASTGITSGSVNANSVTATTFTVPNMITTNITSSRLEMSGTTAFILQSTPSATSSSYSEFNKGSGAVRALVGLDGQGFTGITTGSFTISTPTAHPIYFLTNQTNRMTIHSAGNVGIGTITPSCPLDINGSMKAIGMTIANLYVTGGSLFVNKTSNTGGIVFNLSNPYSRIYDNADLRMWTDDNMYFDIGTQITSANTKLYVNSTGVGINGITPIHPLSINTTTDSPGINPDAYNSLILYEDMQGTSLRYGALSNNASYIRNTGGTTGYVQLSPDSGGSGEWKFYNTNLGNAFTVDYQVQVPGSADAHGFYWAWGDGGEYKVEFHEYQDLIKLFWAGNFLTQVGYGMGNDSNWYDVRIVFQRNTIKVYYRGNLVINYKDTARHHNYSNSECGFYCYTGGLASAHRIREFKIQKLSEGLWPYTTQTSANIMFNGGNVGISTSAPAYTLDVGGTIARSGVRLPVFNNGTFSGASTATIPILFANTTYNYVEIKVRFTLSADSTTNVTLSGNNGSGTNLSTIERNERTVKYNAQSSPVYSSSGLVANSCGGGGTDAVCTITIVQASGGAYGNRYHYTTDTTYCWFGVGTARLYGSGFIGTSINNDARQPLANIILTCAAGNISGTYSTQHSY
jgi:hypothetical protein